MIVYECFDSVVRVTVSISVACLKEWSSLGSHRVGQSGAVGSDMDRESVTDVKAETKARQDKASVAVRVHEETLSGTLTLLLSNSLTSR